jgi:radical SAM superfamily enzyme YgiQ (UPF0313 family)
MLKFGKATICLVIPGSVFLGDPKRNPPLGILYIARALEKDGYDPILVDLRGEEADAYKRLLPAAEIYAFTATSPEYESAAEMAGWVHDKYGSATVLGGVHGTVLKGRIDRRFDIVVVGEGDSAIIEAVHDCESGAARGIYKHDRIRDLDSLGFPARHLLPDSSIVSNFIVDDGEPGTSLSGSRGCPYECTFCSSPVTWGKLVTFRSPDSIVDEIKYLKKTYGVTQIRFQDDTFALREKRCIDLCEKMAPLEIKWRGSSRVDVGQSDEVMEAMRDSGCRELGYGIESLSDNARRLCKKNTSLEQIISATQRAKSYGIRVRWYMMIGLPGEEKGLADKTIGILQEAQPDKVMYATLVAYPGTELARHPERFDMVIKTRDYTKYLEMIGMYEDELETPFTIGYENWTEEELRSERRKIVEFIETHGMGGAK